MSEGKLIDPASSSAKDSIVALQAAAPGRAEVDEVSRALTNRLLDISKQAMNAKAYDRAGQFIAGARSITRIERSIEITGPLSDEQRERLVQIADRCPVKRNIEAGLQVVSAD